MEICRWSRQPLADKFIDYVWDIIEAFRNDTLVVKDKQTIPVAITEETIQLMIDSRIEKLKQELLSVQGKQQLPPLLLCRPQRTNRYFTRNDKTTGCYV